MKISFECGKASGACCKGKHVVETTKVYGANDDYVGKLRFVELCRDQVNNANSYGWSKLTPYEMVSAICSGCKRSFPELQANGDSEFITCHECAQV